MLSFEQASDLIEKRIHNLRFPDKPGDLYDPVRYILSNGGKRIRPALVLLASGLYSDDTEVAMGPALGIEIFHNFTLLHDDLMDHSEMRRNRPTVHVKWNPDTAILSGDVMSIIANDYMTRVDDRVLRNVLSAFVQTSVKVCEGQMLDMEFEKRHDVSEDEYLRMIELKTSVLIAASLRIGALAAGAEEAEADLLFEFGKNLGLAFQLQDDYLDTYGNSEEFGKKIGNDILTNKKTYLMITALNTARGQQLDMLKDLITKPATDPQKKLKDVMKIYHDCTVKERALAKIGEFYRLSDDCLKNLSAPENKKLILREFSSMLMERNK